MRVDVFGEGEALLFVMGWGNRVDSRHERWFVDYLADAGYRVHAVELPTHGTGFEADYLAPLREYREEVGEHRLLAHSMGGLVVAHLESGGGVVYLSPWWGLGEELPVVARYLFGLPVSRPILPVPVDPGTLGGLATEADWTAPGRFSPAWMRTMRDAQRSLPPLAEGDVVFYTPADEVVSPAAIEAHVRPDQLEQYDGGHELFASVGREDHAARVVDALAERRPSRSGHDPSEEPPP